MAAARRRRQAAVSYRDELRAEPYRFDFLAVMRELERSFPGKPRTGDSTVVAEEVVALGQDPYLEFPASNISNFEDTGAGRPRLQTRFLGFFGPQGALPLSTTVEAYHWSNQRDPSFARFTDIFSVRFLQLFYRAWADARPIAQHDRPADDRFMRYVGSAAGIGSEPYMDRDSVEDIAKIPFAGLTASFVKSASRLRQLIRGVFEVDLDVEERIGSWLSFEPGDRMMLGASGSSLGVDSFLGGRLYSINEKVRIFIRTTSLAQYRGFLPSGSTSGRLADIVFYYLGHRYEFDVQLALPKRLAPPARLGVSGELGWTSWIAPDTEAAGEKEFLSDARFDPMLRRRAAAEAETGHKGAGAQKREAGNGRHQS
jgi:type VI secretion system protein ImpH